MGYTKEAGWGWASLQWANNGERKSVPKVGHKLVSSYWQARGEVGHEGFGREPEAMKWTCRYCGVTIDTSGQIGICPHCGRYIKPEWYGKPREWTGVSEREMVEIEKQKELEVMVGAGLDGMRARAKEIVARILAGQVK